MLEHDKIRDLQGAAGTLTHQSDARVTHCCCRLSLSFERTAEGLIMLNIFDESAGGTSLCFGLSLKKFLQIFVVCFCVHPWLINEYAVMVLSCCH